MSHIDNKRRTMSLSIGIFVGIILLAVSLIGSRVFELQSSLAEFKKYEKVKLEEYLDESIDVQFRLLQSIENSWNDYLFLNPDCTEPDTYTKKYVYSHISEIPNVAMRSAIIVLGENDNEIFTGYTDGKYHNIHDLIKTKEFKDNTLVVLNGKKDLPFGTGDRIYISRKTLKLQDGYFYVYVGFSEKIMHEGFVNSLNSKALATIETEVNNILWILGIFMIICIAYGMYLIFYMTYFQGTLFNLCPDKCLENKDKS